MADARNPAQDGSDDAVLLEHLGPPRGTLVIVIAFAVLFGLAWVAMYVFLFLQRGAPHA